MKRLLLFFIFITHIGYTQTEDDSALYFSEALFTHLPKYEQKSKLAYYQRDYAEAERLFDSLVNFCLSGSYMNNFKFRNLKKKEVELYNYNKPVYFITYASWCVQGKGEISALNELAKKYSKKIDFVVLYWNNYKIAKKEAKKFSEDISVVYVDETRNEGAYIVKQLKHSLGLPTCFLLSADKKVLDIRRSLFLPYDISKKESFDRNYKDIENSISQHLLEQGLEEEIELAENTILPK